MTDQTPDSEPCELAKRIIDTLVGNASIPESHRDASYDRATAIIQSFAAEMPSADRFDNGWYALGLTDERRRWTGDVSDGH